MATMARPAAIAPVAAMEQVAAAPVAAASAPAAAGYPAAAMSQAMAPLATAPQATAPQATAPQAMAPPAQAPVVQAAPAQAAPVVAQVAQSQHVKAAARRVAGGTKLTPQERRQATQEAELYAIFTTTEHLERAFVRGAISDEDYTKHCNQLIAHFKTAKPLIPGGDCSAWMKAQDIHCPLAEERLLVSGVPSTVLHATASTGTDGVALAAFKASEAFITLTDALKMDLTSVDEVFPLLRELCSAIVEIPNLPAIAGVDKIQVWLAKVNNMRAADSLSEEDCRQLAMDVETAYTSLKGWLQDKR